MRYRALLFILTITVMSGGCSVGQVDGLAADDGGDPEDAASFSMIVSPIVTRCAGATCHSGVQAPNLSSFAALQPQYKVKPATTNRLITKKAELAAANNAHQTTTYFDATEEAAVRGWIDSLGTP
jgi:hypothetical protein